jgi:hypothetical protein
MKSSRQFKPLFTSLVVTLAFAGNLFAGGVDMKDPRRALGREDDIRVDAQLLRDSVSPHAPLAATYQIENLSNSWIAVADRVTDVSYDPAARTLTFTIGAEIPTGKAVPHLVTIAPGQKKTLNAAGTVRVVIPARGVFTAAPRYVQLKVNVLRDITAFSDVLARQGSSETPVAMNDEVFAHWLDANDSILLNALPVQWETKPDPHSVAADNGRGTENFEATAGTW